MELCPTGKPRGDPACIKVTDWPTPNVPFVGLTPGAVSFARAWLHASGWGVAEAHGGAHGAPPPLLLEQCALPAADP